ncbi:MAG: uracil-DNA glycosylase [bacterium]
MNNQIPSDWNTLLGVQTYKDYWSKLNEFVSLERLNQQVFPAQNEVFAALKLTPYKDVAVVILGQDPYHNDGQAMGLSFSVPGSTKIPPSLANIYKELAADVGIGIKTNGDLSGWSKQGVLLLNSVLTVRAHQASSHSKKGWEQFTDAVLKAVSDKPEHVVFILWGSFAQKKKHLIDESRHTILESVHPSPLSAYAGFFGSKPFSKANSALKAHNQKVIDWNK